MLLRKFTTKATKNSSKFARFFSEEVTETHKHEETVSKRHKVVIKTPEEPNILYRNNQMDDDFSLIKKFTYTQGGIFTSIGALCCAFEHPFIGAISLLMGTGYFMSKPIF